MCFITGLIIVGAVPFSYRVEDSSVLNVLSRLREIELLRQRTHHQQRDAGIWVTEWHLLCMSRIRGALGGTPNLLTIRNRGGCVADAACSHWSIIGTSWTRQHEHRTRTRHDSEREARLCGRHLALAAEQFDQRRGRRSRQNSQILDDDQDETVNEPPAGTWSWLDYRCADSVLLIVTVAGLGVWLVIRS